jgi:hypothetical protein
MARRCQLWRASAANLKRRSLPVAVAPFPRALAHAEGDVPPFGPQWLAVDLPFPVTPERRTRLRQRPRGAIAVSGLPFAPARQMTDSYGWGPGSAGAIDFEARMRRRRFMHCVRQADVAITSGAAEHALIALDEARGLFPDAPELAVLDARIAAGGDGLAMPAAPVLASGSFDDDDMSDALGPLSLRAEYPADPRLRDEGAVARGRLPRAIVPLAVTGLLGFGLGQLSTTRLELVKPAGISAWATGMLVGLRETLRPDIPQPSGPPALPPELARVDPPLTPTATSGGTETTTQSSQPEADGDVAPLADGDVSTLAADEEIRAVLKRYEVAYNQLQAKAARSESRRADSGSSQPAFDSVLARQISLGFCDITMSGEVSTATCTGTTALDPRSGGGGRTHRFWAFDLRRNADGWRVERLTVN